MPDAPISVDGLTKQYGAHAAVDGLTFAIQPGRVTGFLGPNGSGKTTTIRMVVGLAGATSGEALVFGQRFVDLPEPSRTVGVMIDASAFHPGRRVRHELAIQAALCGVERSRVDAVLALVGLEAAGAKRVGALSLGMRQRLALGAALLGEPPLLILDEPANGLDPAGIHWLRALLRDLATEGTAVFVSSHVLSELALFADDVVVINHGRLVLQSPVASLLESHASTVIVRSPEQARLRRLLAAAGGRTHVATNGLAVTGLTAETVGELAASERVVLHELRTDIVSLEDVFLELTDDAEQIR